MPSPAGPRSHAKVTPTPPRKNPPIPRASSDVAVFLPAQLCSDPAPYFTLNSTMSLLALTLPWLKLKY